MNSNDPWRRLAEAARRAPDSRDVTAPHGFAARVAARALQLAHAVRQQRGGQAHGGAGARARARTTVASGEDAGKPPRRDCGDRLRHAPSDRTLAAHTTTLLFLFCRCSRL